MSKIVDTAIKAAERASEVLLNFYQKLSFLEVEEKAKNDFVTEADKSSEQVIIQTIKEAFPEHAVIAEETGSHGQSNWKWYVDPLDGTKNFIHGVPFFCISIGVELNGELIAGVVRAPVLKETFVAEKGEGAYCNEERIKVNEREFESSMVATGFPFRGKHLIDEYLACFKEVFLNVSAVRRCGSAALDLAYTAKGVFDGFWEMALNPWDIAAGVILVKEAEGIVSDFEGKEGFLKTGNIIGASPKVYDKLLKIIQKHLL
jgi:myo-inositol-1(or 4)-monophosphatase